MRFKIIVLVLLSLTEEMEVDAAAAFTENVPFLTPDLHGNVATWWNIEEYFMQNIELSLLTTLFLSFWRNVVIETIWDIPLQFIALSSIFK